MQVIWLIIVVRFAGLLLSNFIKRPTSILGINPDQYHIQTD